MEVITAEVITGEKKRDARGHRLYDQERKDRILEGYDKSGLAQKATFGRCFRGEDLPVESLPIFNSGIVSGNMTLAKIEFCMTLIGTFCWGFCFWWMGCISSKQNRLMDQLKEQGRRIEKLSKVEHDLIKEVHPKVGEIRDGIEEVIAVVKENTAVQKDVNTAN